MAEEEKDQGEQESQAGSDSDTSTEEGGQQDKISGLEVGLMTILLGVVPDAIEFGLVLILLDDFWISDTIFFTTSEIYSAIRGVDGRIYARAGNIAELIPYAGALPLRTIGWSAAFYAHNHPNSWLGRKIAKIGEGLSKIEKGVAVAKGAGVRRGTMGREPIDVSPGAQEAQNLERARMREESINPESMSAMSELPKMETHGFPNKKDQEGEDDQVELSKPAQKTSGVNKKLGGSGESASPGIEDFDMGDRPQKRGAPRPYSPGLPDKPSWVYDQKAERAGQQLKQDVEYAKMTGGDVKEVFDNYFRNQFVNADSLRNKSGNAAVPLPPDSGKEGENVVELKGKQVDLRKAA